MPRPTPSQVAAATGATIPDLLGPPGARLRVLFGGINPGLYSGATGRHFARPGNRFWAALHRSGFTPRQLDPAEQDQLPAYGLGVTNLVARATARADELAPAELRAGAARLAGLAEQHAPAWIAVLGITAYRTGFGRPGSVVGRQPERLGPSGVWVLPNPSGLNARYQLDALVAQFAELRAESVR